MKSTIGFKKTIILSFTICVVSSCGRSNARLPNSFYDEQVEHIEQDTCRIDGTSNQLDDNASDNMYSIEDFEHIQERTSEGIVPTKQQVDLFVPYQRIVIFGVDGAGSAFEQADCPCFRRIFADGNVNYHGVSQFKTISAENWCSMFYGVSAQTHKKTNSYVSEVMHNDENLPSVIKTYGQRHKDKTFCSIVNWTPINYGILENIDSISKQNPRVLYPDFDSYKIDLKVCEMAIERIKKNDDTIAFFHFDYVDAAGHLYGSESAEYYRSISFVDGLIGNIYSAYEEMNAVDSTLFICVSDHGHSKDGGHGGETEPEKEAMLAIAESRGDIIKGCCGKYVTHDLASIILYSLGETQPSHYEGGVPKDLFVGL